MSLAEYMEWQEYASVEPWGSHYDDLRAGTIASAIYNVNRDPNKCEAFKALQFVPWNRLSECAKQPILLEDKEEQSKLIDRIFAKSTQG